MKKELVISARAFEQMIEAAEWYESQQPGLGKRFIDSWEQTIRHLEKYPFHYQKRYKSYRIALIARFPYVISFEEDKTVIIVYRTIHAHRRPSKRYQK